MSYVYTPNDILRFQSSGDEHELTVIVETINVELRRHGQAKVPVAWMCHYAVDMAVSKCRDAGWRVDVRDGILVVESNDENR